MLHESFREGMSRAAATVNVVTTDGPAGRAGVTVSAMCPISADRPALLVCVHRLSPACAAIKANGRFCVNLLREDQAPISDVFAGRIKRPDGDKFGCAAWRRLATGAPALEEALVAFDCTLMQHLDWDSHSVFIADVVDVELARPGRPLVYANRSYGIPQPA